MENKIEDYIILESQRNSGALREMVLMKIKEGYVPLGGVAVSVSKEFNYYQAMVKYSK
ncbi:hypothetical protein IWX84_003116 [Flavobacterium sp. CG_9.10]|uniref:hypothetical protein n=1 Tax=Flavobacterium sp. CG_9.10 TaxID=2787729 RepID=UPI0018C98A50|nr:hypothetical protein [Flavobacterium sp. CG_9.10]MBG6112213.1 hypothetical protein [Flavobacterium sp. CG_9.10]